MKTVAMLLLVLPLLAACGSGSTSSAPTSPTTSSTLVASSTVTTTAPTTTVVLTEATSPSAVPEVPSDDVLAARSAVVTMLGANAGSYLDQVGRAWPLSTGDRVYTASAYALVICAAKQAGVTFDVMKSHVVGDFQKQYSIAISQKEGDTIVAAAWDTVCD